MDQLYENYNPAAQQTMKQPKAAGNNNQAQNAAQMPSDMNNPTDEEIRLAGQPDFVGFCWSCTVADWQAGDAKQTCLDQGHMAACSEGNNGCYSIIRKRGGSINSIQMGCTQMQACKNEENANFINTPKRCKPDATNPRRESHCASCCNPKQESNCNLNFVDGSSWDPTESDYINHA